MKMSDAGLALLKSFEGLRLNAYQDVAGIWTIGYGTIRYPDGMRVKKGDTCTEALAEAYLRHDLSAFEKAVDDLTVDDLTQAQFDALCSFVYNVGSGDVGYKGSMLRKRVNNNPDDPTIRPQFMRWYKAGGVGVEGLWKRRHKEADFYFGMSTPCPPFPSP